MGIMLTGFYARLQFQKRPSFNWGQKLALFLIGAGIVVIVNKLNIQSIYKLSIVMVAGLLLPNVVNAIIRAGEKSEDTAANNISKKIDKLTD